MNEVLNLASLLQPKTLLLAIVATFLGIVVGALPGLTATMAVSILVSLTFGLNTAEAIVILISVFLGGIYGGSRSAILLNVPGTPSSAATALDGWPLSKKGEGGEAGVVVTSFSSLGGLVGLLVLALLTPVIAKFALKFGYWEYFWLAMMGVLISATLTTGEVKNYKGIITGFAGMLIACVGLDPIHGVPRLCFDVPQLYGGINLVPAMIGLFGLTEAFYALMEPSSHDILDVGPEERLGTLIKKSFSFLKKYPVNFLRSSIIGTFIGALPGVGPDIASWVAYGTAKKQSKTPEEFGQGSYEGIIASETANNAATSGVFIPLLTLGIPGDAVSAIILGGIQMHGYKPGPTFFFENPGFVYFLAGSLLIVNIIMWIEGCAITRVISKILKAPVGILMPIVMVFCVFGAYMINLRKFDVILMLCFGLLGIVMRKFKLPPAPMALGIILGTLADTNFRQAMLAGRYSVAPFFTRPLSLVMFLVILIALVSPMLKRFRKIK